MPENEFDIEHRLTTLEDYKKIVVDKIYKLEQDTSALHELATSVAVMATKMGAVEKSVDEIKDTVSEIKSKPEKKMDGLVEKVVACIISALVTFIAVKLGLA